MRGESGGKWVVGWYPPYAWLFGYYDGWAKVVGF
jgi:hypothetical protein